MIKINGERLWQRLMEIGEIGAIENTTGCNRQALTEQDKIGRELFIKWAKQAGCEIRIDQIGNIFATRSGKDNSLPAVISGSHLDTQPTGGKYDGIYGCLAALEVLQTLEDSGVETEHPLEAIVWTNEEGCRFSTAMMGSAVWAGNVPLEDAYNLKDAEGISVLEALKSIGHKGDTPAKSGDVKAAFEAHIEQGPVLEADGKTIGVVSSVQWMSRHEVKIYGQEAHAGPTPMRLRKDPMRALSEILPACYQAATMSGEEGRITFGYIDAAPGSNNTVPGCLTFTIDIRHPEQNQYQFLIEKVYSTIKSVCSNAELEFSVNEFWSSPGITFAESCVSSVAKAVDSLGYSAKEMFSGAGHDACNVSTVAPTSMIFIPCKDGLSHNVNEFATPQDIEAGANVLLHAMLDQAGVVESAS